MVAPAVPVQRRDRPMHVGSGAADGEHGRAALGDPDDASVVLYGQDVRQHAEPTLSTFCPGKEPCRHFARPFAVCQRTASALKD